MALAIVGSLLWPVAPAGAQAQKTSSKIAHAAGVKARTRKRQAKPAPPPEIAQPAPIAPMTPEQLPAAPPQVSYQNGQLTIQSQNSTLADILSAVRRVTGAQLDTPVGFGMERVATRLGPGPARDVISALLDGSNFGYIVLGSLENPGAVDKIMVMAQTAASAAPTNTANMAPRGSPSPPPADYTPDEDENTQEVPPPPPQPPESQPGVIGQPGMAMPPGAAAQPGMAGQFVPPGVQGQGAPGIAGTQPLNPNEQQPSAEANPNQPKTPEQLLQELQRMRIQRMQQLQQQQQQQQSEP